MAFNKGRKVDLNDDGADDFIFWGFDDDGDGKPDGEPKRADLVDLDIPGWVFAPIPDPRRKKKLKGSSIFEYIGSKVRVDVEAVHRFWRRIERGVWALIVCLALIFGYWLGAAGVPIAVGTESAKLLRKALEEEAEWRDGMPDDFVRDAEEAVETDTGKKPKTLK